MRDLLAAFGALDPIWRAVIFVAIGLLSHVVVLIAQHITLWFSSRGSRVRLRRLQSLASLLSSAMVFALYFLVVGLILSEFGVSLTAYLASASVLGLAIGFGSQGLVQDVVTGLTLIGRNPEPRPGEVVAGLVPMIDMTRSVSKTHASVRWDGATLWVADRGSTNGTALVRPGAQPVRLGTASEEEAPVGSQLRLGERVFRVEATA